MDFISALLAVIGIAIVLAGIFGFLSIRTRAKKQAEEVARKVSEEIAEKAANNYIQAKFPEIFAAYSAMAKEVHTVDSTSANDIASAQDERNE